MTEKSNVHHLPPMRRAIPSDDERAAMQPVAARFAAMTDRSLSYTLGLLIEEIRHRRTNADTTQARQLLAASFHNLAEDMRRAGLNQLIVDRAAEIGLERMTAGDLDALASHMNGRDSGDLGGVA
jgi:serine phosphatase RsbU (regulator of sigma subunit)